MYFYILLSRWSEIPAKNKQLNADHERSRITVSAFSAGRVVDRCTLRIRQSIAIETRSCNDGDVCIYSDISVQEGSRVEFLVLPFSSFTIIF